jgi:hypothetical protein
VVYDLTQSRPLVASPNTKCFKCNLHVVKVTSHPVQVVGDFNRNLYYVPNLNVTQRSTIIDPLAKVVPITGYNEVCLLICNCGCMKGSYPCINKFSADTNTLWHSVEYRL